MNEEFVWIKGNVDKVIKYIILCFYVDLAIYYIR